MGTDQEMNVIESGNEILESASTAPITAISQPDRLLEMAIQKGADMESLDKLLQLKERYDNELARKAFHLALAEFKKNPPIVVKDMLNKQYGSNYVSIGNMVNTVNEEAGKHGLSARWDFPRPEGGLITVTCILAHKLGHEESVTLYGEIDKSGSKNSLQGPKSTRTYLKLETYEAVMGVASVDGNVNDDGNSSGAPMTSDSIKWEKVDSAYDAFKTVIDEDVEEMDFQRVKDGWSRLTNDEQQAVFSKFGKEKPADSKLLYRSILKTLLAMEKK